MPADFSGTWINDHSEGWLPLLKFRNVPADKIHEMTNLLVTNTITQSGNTLTIVTVREKDLSTRKELTINVGSNFTNNVMGRDVEYSSEWKGDQLITRALGGESGSVRELVGGDMVVTFDIEGFVAKTYYKKQ